LAGSSTAKYSLWKPNDPKRPYTKGPKVQEGVVPFEKSDTYSFFKTTQVRVLDPPSLQRVRDICRSRLGGLVIRRVKLITPSKNGEYEYWLNSPESRTKITREEYDELSDHDKRFKVETIFHGTYSLVTSSKSALPTRDAFAGEACFAKSSGRAEFDPMTLRLELAEGRPMPRESNRKSYDKDDPASLVCGYVTRDPESRKLVFRMWTIISVQEQHAILAMLEPTVIHPSKKGEIKEANAYRAWLMGGGRLSTNVFRRKVCSEKANKTPLSDEVKEEIYTRYIGSPWGLHHCHILNFWVLMCRYGELPAPGNLPTIIPTIPPNDPEKQANYYEDKSLPYWDLPMITVGDDPENKGKKRRLRMDDAFVEMMQLKFTSKMVDVPVNPRADLPRKVIAPPKLEDQPGQNDVGIIATVPREDLPTKISEEIYADAEAVSSDSDAAAAVASDTDSEADSDTDTGDTSKLAESLDSGLSSDSESDRSDTPSTEVEVVAQEAFIFKSWADVVEGDDEMDYAAPIKW